NVHAAAVRQALDRRRGIAVFDVNRDVRAELTGNGQPLLAEIEGDDECRALQLRAQRRAQADWALREDGDRSAYADVAALGARQARGKDVGAQHHVLIAQGVGNRREVRAGVGHQQILGPRAVDRVAEAPTSDAAAALGVRSVQAVEALP